MAWACMAASGTGSLVFIDDVTADKSRMMNSEVFRAILSAHIQPNASQLIGRRFTVQMDKDPKHTAKATKEFLKGKKWTVMQWPSQSPDLNPIKHAFHLLKTKLKGKCPKNKQELKTVAVEAWQSITRDETRRLVMSMRSRLQTVIDCKGFATKYEKVKVWFMIIILSHYFWSLNKWEAHMQTVVIPTPFTWFGCKYPQIKADSLQLKHVVFVSFEIHCGGV